MYIILSTSTCYRYVPVWVCILRLRSVVPSDHGRGQCFTLACRKWIVSNFVVLFSFFLSLLQFRRHNYIQHNDELYHWRIRRKSIPLQRRWQWRSLLRFPSAYWWFLWGESTTTSTAEPTAANELSASANASTIRSLCSSTYYDVKLSSSVGTDAANVLATRQAAGTPAITATATADGQQVLVGKLYDLLDFGIVQGLLWHWRRWYRHTSQGSYVGFLQARAFPKQCSWSAKVGFAQRTRSLRAILDYDDLDLFHWCKYFLGNGEAMAGVL